MQYFDSTYKTGLRNTDSIQEDILLIKATPPEGTL